MSDVCGECGLPGSFSRQAQPWGLVGWCDACWIAQRKFAWKIYNAARRDRRLVPQDSCQGCGRSDVKLTGHHPDYLRPLDVRWLCSTCHTKAHRGVKS